MEADCEALTRFVTPGEAGHFWVTLSQMKCHWDELKGRVEQLEGHLSQSVSSRQRYSDSLEQVTTPPGNRGRHKGQRTTPSHCVFVE